MTCFFDKKGLQRQALAHRREACEFWHLEQRAPFDPLARRNPERPPISYLPDAWRLACEAADVLEGRSRCLGRGRCGRAEAVYRAAERLSSYCPGLGVDRVHAWVARATAPGAAEHDRRLIIELRKNPQPDAALMRWWLAIVRREIPEVPLKLS